MDTDQIAELLRGLRTTPSRRAVGTALGALAASTALSPFFEHATAGGKGGGGKGGGKGNGKGKGKGKGKDKKKKKWNIDELPPLPPPPPPCPLGQSLCGDATSLNRFCYSAAEETCCPKTPIGAMGACPKLTFCVEFAEVPYCCPSGSQQCLIGCCPQGTFCCPTVGCCDNSACDPGIFGGSCSAILPAQSVRTS
jgi:hypothetical protein